MTKDLVSVLKHEAIVRDLAEKKNRPILIFSHLSKGGADLKPVINVVCVHS